AAAGAEHAHRAVLGLEGDHAAGPGDGDLGRALVRVLDGVGADRRGRQHRLDAPLREHRLHEDDRRPLQADEEALEGERAGGPSHQNATFRTIVARMLTRARGMRAFHAKACSWSSRNRGNVKRAQKMRAPTSIIFTKSTSGPTTFMTLSSRSTPGIAQPPRNRVAARAAKTAAEANSAMKKSRKRMPEYSVM